MRKSQQKVVEEILDESTGQIVERTRIVRTNAKSDDDDTNEGTGGDSNDDDGECCIINYPHASIIKKCDSVNIQPVEVSSPDGNGSFFRCPLCPLSSAYYNVQSSKVLDHMNGNKHFKIAVKHKGLLICKCDETTCTEPTTNNSDQTTQKSSSKDAALKSHRHCPHCGRIITRRNEFHFHIERCCPYKNNPIPKKQPQQQQQQQKQANSSTTINDILASPAAAAAATPTPNTTIITQAQVTQNQCLGYFITTGPGPASVVAVTAPVSVPVQVVSQSPLTQPQQITTKPNEKPAPAPSTPITTNQIQTRSSKRKLNNNTRESANNHHDSVDDIHLDLEDLNNSGSNKLQKSNEPPSIFPFQTNGATISSSSSRIEYINGNSAASTTSSANSNINRSDSTSNSSDLITTNASSNIVNNNHGSTTTTPTSNSNGLPQHIQQNYSILAHQLTTALDGELEAKSWNPKPVPYQSSKDANSPRSQKDIATCQFCGRAMLKKNIPTHIRRAHTPKEELVCLNEEQNLFTFQHLKPGQRRKRSARAYDYSLMTATVSIDDDPSDGIENKFITEGEEILSTDLLQLADRVKFGISQIPGSTLTKLIDILTKIEYSTTDEINANAKAIKNMIVLYLTSSEEFKYKVKQIGDDIADKKKQVNSLRADLKEIMTRKAQLERRIQPIICDLQKLEDQHGGMIDTMMQLNGLIQLEIVHEEDNENDDDEDVTHNDEDESSTSALVC